MNRNVKLGFLCQGLLAFCAGLFGYSVLSVNYLFKKYLKLI